MEGEDQLLRRSVGIGAKLLCGSRPETGSVGIRQGWVIGERISRVAVGTADSYNKQPVLAGHALAQLMDCEQRAFQEQRNRYY